MCEYCLQVKVVQHIPSTVEYENIIKYIKGLVETKQFVLTDCNCALGKHKNCSGQWVDDMIFHTIRCPKCGQEFSCTVNSYRGGGSFNIGH